MWTTSAEGGSLFHFSESEINVISPAEASGEGKAKAVRLYTITHPRSTSTDHTRFFSKGFGLNCAMCPFFTLFSSVCATTPYLSSAKAGTIGIAMGSDTSPHVLRFTGFDHRRERRRLEDAFLTNAAATVRSVGAV